ncbi:F-box domain-containing protein [Mycena kentingensis (nom. inval.)]|nr:F-box domain-containing protein [Mycena kentingensis (nom. inval.)]
MTPYLVVTTIAVSRRTLACSSTVYIPHHPPALSSRKISVKTELPPYMGERLVDRACCTRLGRADAISESKIVRLPTAGDGGRRVSLRVADWRCLPACMVRVGDIFRVVQHRLSPSPVLTLPNEITAEIFAYYAESIAERETLASAPTVLVQVCRAWRQLALSLPKIWATVFFGTESSPAIDRHLRLWFERAGSEPLKVYASGASPRSHALLVAFSDQLESLTCALPPPSGSSLDTFKGRIGNLKELNLIVKFEDNVDSPMMFSDAPSLRKLSLSSNVYCDGLQFPWSQLTELYVSSTLPDLLQTIEQIACLQILQLPSFGDYRRPLAPINLPRLHTLRCTPIYSSSLQQCGFFQHLHCPVLETLQLSGPFAGDCAAIVISFVRSATLLRVLTLSAISAVDTLKILTAAPGTENLTLQGESGGHNVLMKLASPALLPTLQHLNIQYPDIFQPYQTLSYIVEARGSSSARSGSLRSLTYLPTSNGSDPPAKDDREGVAKLVAQTRGELGGGCKVKVAAPQVVRIQSDCKPAATVLTPLYFLGESDNEEE